MIQVIKFVVFLLLTVGCSSYKSPSARLADAVYRYNDAVRWRNYVAAANYVSTKDRKDYLEKRRALNEDMKILEFEVGSVRHIKHNEVAEIQVRFTWHQLPSLMVKTTMFKQRWLYNDKKKWIFAGQQELEAPPAKKVTPVSDRF